MQARYEQQEIQEEERMKRILEARERGESPLPKSPPKYGTPAYLTNDEFKLCRTGSTSYFQTPGKQIKSTKNEVGKSPIIEYLKQAQKDHLLPHFMPFKKLQETTNQLLNGGQGLKYCLDQFSINIRNAPSIASAVMNI